MKNNQNDHSALMPYALPTELFGVRSPIQFSTLQFKYTLTIIYTYLFHISTPCMYITVNIILCITQSFHIHANTMVSRKIVRNIESHMLKKIYSCIFKSINKIPINLNLVYCMYIYFFIIHTFI